jgi:hypothetical protein
MRPGKVVLPRQKINFFYKSSEVAGKSRSSLLTSALEFDVTLPAALKDAPFFIVTPKLTVSDDISVADGDQIAVGSSVERIIYLIAQDVPAMMLPEFSFDEQDGLKAYVHTPVVSDVYRPRENVNQTHKEQKLSYFVEKPGLYTLPAIKIVWWDVNRAERKVVAIAEHIIHAGGASKTNEQPLSAVPKGRASRDSHISWRKWGLIFLMVLPVGVIVFSLRYLWKKHATSAANLRAGNISQLRKEYISFIKDQSYINAIDCLYTTASLNSVTRIEENLADTALKRSFHDLMRCAFSEKRGTDLGQLDEQAALAVFDKLNEKHSVRRFSVKFGFSMSLN